MNKYFSIITLTILLYISPGCIGTYKYHNFEVSIRDIQNDVGVPSIKIETLHFSWGDVINGPKSDCAITDSNGNARMMIPMGSVVVSLLVQDDGQYGISYEIEQELEKNGWARIEKDNTFTPENKRKYYMILKEIEPQIGCGDTQIIILIPGP